MKIPAYFPIVAALLCATVSPAQDSEKPRAEMREKMQKIKREIEELRASGRQDEAKRLEERARAEMGKQGGDSERMQHIGEAIKHLRAAGLNEPAERIEQLARETQKAGEGNLEQAGPREGMEQMQRAMREMQEQTQRAMREMHQHTQEQMAKMARTIEELREQVAKRDKRE